MSDPIRPAHYNQGGMECYDALEACMGGKAFRHMLHGDAMAYLWRLHLKGDPLENAQKARRCLDRWIESVEKARAEVAGQGEADVGSLVGPWTPAMQRIHDLLNTPQRPAGEAGTP